MTTTKKKAYKPRLKKATRSSLEEKLRKQHNQLKLRDGKLEQGVSREKLGADREKIAEEQIYIQTKAMEAALDGIFIIDAKNSCFSVIYANSSFQELTGYQKKDVIGKNYFLLYGPGADLRIVDEIKKTMRQGRSFHGQMLNFKKNGDKFWTSLRIAPVRDTKGVVTHFVGTQTDITLMK